MLIPAILIAVNLGVLYLIWKDHSEDPNDLESIINQLKGFFQ